MEQQSSASRVLRVPSPWTVVLLGFYHEHAIVLVMLIALAPIGVLIGVGADNLPEWAQLALVIGTVVLISGSARHYVAAPLTRLFKRLFASKVRVAYLRSFREDDSYAARDQLGPILGCIGRLTTVHNPDYIQGLTDVDGHSQQEDAWFAWLELGEILGDGLAAVKLEDARWQEDVLEILRTSDLAVIDLTEASDNLIWELTRALEILPGNRVLTLCRQGTAAPEHAPRPIEYETSLKGRYRLRSELRRRLAAVASQQEST